MPNVVYEQNWTNMVLLRLPVPLALLVVLVVLAGRRRRPPQRKNSCTQPIYVLTATDEDETSYTNSRLEDDNVNK